MRKKLLAVILCASMLFPASVSAEVLGYEATLDTYTKEKKTPQQFQIDDGAGNTVNVLAKSDTLYVTAKNTEIRSNPGDSGTELRSVKRKVRTRSSVMFRTACSVIRRS